MLSVLEKNRWDVVSAAIEAGYGETYAKKNLPARIRKNTELCRRIQALKDAANSTQGQKVDKLVRSWEKLADDEHVSPRDRLKAGELLGKYHGIFSERHVIEDGRRQQELDASRAAEARWLAAQRFDTMSLPGDSAPYVDKALSTGQPAAKDAVFEPENTGDTVRKVVTNAEQSTSQVSMGDSVSALPTEGTVESAPMDAVCSVFESSLQSPPAAGAGTGGGVVDACPAGATPIPPSDPRRRLPLWTLNFFWVA